MHNKMILKICKKCINIDTQYLDLIYYNILANYLLYAS